MAVGKDEVHRAVIVIVEKFHTPAAEQARGLCDCVFVRGVEEGFILVVGVEREHFVVDVADEQIFPAVGIDVRCVDAHARARLTVLAEADPGNRADLLPLVVPAIDEQEVFHGVVGNEQVHAPVIVNVGGHHAQAFAHGPLDRCAGCDIGERAVAVVVKELSMRGLVQVRRAIVAAAETIWTRNLVCVIDIAAYVEIQAAVVIVIEPHGARGPAGQRQAGLLGHVGERAVAVVVVQNRPAVSGDQQVRIAIVVELDAEVALTAGSGPDRRRPRSRRCSLAGSGSRPVCRSRKTASMPIAGSSVVMVTVWVAPVTTAAAGACVALPKAGLPAVAAARRRGGWAAPLRDRRRRRQVGGAGGARARPRSPAWSDGASPASSGRRGRHPTPGARRSRRRRRSAGGNRSRRRGLSMRKKVTPPPLPATVSAWPLARA